MSTRMFADLHLPPQGGGQASTSGAPERIKRQTGITSDSSTQELAFKPY